MKRNPTFGDVFDVPPLGAGQRRAERLPPAPMPPPAAPPGPAAPPSVFAGIPDYAGVFDYSVPSSRRPWQDILNPPLPDDYKQGWNYDAEYSDRTTATPLARDDQQDWYNTYGAGASTPKMKGPRRGKPPSAAKGNKKTKPAAPKPYKGP